MSHLDKKRAQHPNSNYGQGCYRCRIRLTGKHLQVKVELEDDVHGFIVCIEHDQQQVTGIEAQTFRYPFSTCNNATQPLQQLLGCPLASSSQVLSKYANSRLQCTHLFDMTGLAIAHCPQQLLTFK